VSGVLGQIPGTRDLASPDFKGQARQAMENLKASVEAAGSSMDKVVKCSAFLTESSDFQDFNRIYVEYFPTEPPARSTVIVKALVAAGAKIEIDCVAIA
jgi:2-iminobutanoate/2-iminopropanoate deaminase